jgi:transposase
MDVIIGIDPHKASHMRWRSVMARSSSLGCRCAAAATSSAGCWPGWRRSSLDDGRSREPRVSGSCWRSSSSQPTRMSLTCRPRWRHRHVCVGSARSNKNDPNVALSVALTGLRCHDLRAVVPAGSCELFRLPSKRHIDLSNQRIRLVSRVHALAVELSPGGIGKELNSTDAAKFLTTLTPTDPVAQLRTELAAAIAGIETQIRQSRLRIRNAVNASGTSVTDIFGVGPIIAAMPPR